LLSGEHKNTVLSEAPSGQARETFTHRIWQTWRFLHVKTQLDGRFDLLDILSARPGCTEEVFGQFRVVDRDRAGDWDQHRKARTFRKLARRCGAGASREVGLLSVKTLDIENFYTRHWLDRISRSNIGPLNAAKAMIPNSSCGSMSR
jgi:hypothetical protein